MAGGTPLSAHPSDKQRTGDAQIGNVEHNDCDGCEYEERALVTHVHHEQRNGKNTGRDRRYQWGLGSAVHPGDRRGERQTAVATHCEDHADRARVNGQAANGDRDRGVDQEDVSNCVTERRLNQERQPRSRDLWRVE